MSTVKKTLCILLACVMLLTVLPAIPALAAGELMEGTHVRWSYNSDTKTLTFTGYGPMPDYDLNAPPNLPWHDAVEEVETVVFSNGITAIGDGCFPYLPALRRAAFPESLLRIGVANFYCCKNLTDAALPEGLLFLGEHSFWLTGIARAEIPVGVKTLEYAFGLSPALTEVVLHEGLERIESCFSYAPLESLELPASLISVTGCEFIGLKKLVNHSLTAVAHEQMDSIRDPADRELLMFALRLECELDEAYYSMLLRGQTEESELVAEQLMYEAMEKARLWLNETYGVALETPEDVMDYFEAHVYVTGAPAPDAEIYCISGSAEDQALDKTGIPHFLIDGDSVPCVNPPEWSGAAGEHIVWAVDGETGTLTFTGYGRMDESLETAAYHRLSDRITDVAFECTDGPITFIGSGAFKGLANVTSLTLPEGVETIGSEFIADSGVRTLTMPAAVNYLYWDAMRTGSAPLQRIEVTGEGGYYTSHGALYERVFDGEENWLVKLTPEAAAYLPEENVSRIEGYALDGLRDLTAFTIPGTVQMINYNAFYDLPLLETVFIEPGNDRLRTGMDADAFGGSTSIAGFSVQADDERFFVRDGVLYDKPNMRAIAVPGRTRSLDLAADIKSIGYNAVRDDVTLDRLTVRADDFTFFSESTFRYYPYDFTDEHTVIVCNRGSVAEGYALHFDMPVEYLDGVTLTGISIKAAGPLTATQYEECVYAELGIYAELTYSDGAVGTCPVQDLWFSDYPDDWFADGRTFDELGDHELKVRLGSAVETFTLTVVPNPTAYRFDVSAAITDFAVYEEISSTSLGAKLLRIDPVTGEETEIRIGSECDVSVWNGEEWTENGTLCFREEGTYRLRLEYRGFTQELEVNVTEDEVRFTTNAEEAVTEIPRFTHYDKEYGGNRLFATRGGATTELTAWMTVGPPDAGISNTSPMYYDYNFLFPDTTVPGDATFCLYAYYGFNESGTGRYRSFRVALPLQVTIVPGDVTDAYLDLSAVPDTLPTQTSFTPGELGIRLVKVMSDGSVQIDENPEGFFHWIYMPGIYGGKTLDTPYGSTTLYVKFHYGSLMAQFNVDVHSHSLTFVPAAAGADCRMQGNIDHWHCTSCGRNFADETASAELETVWNGIYGPHTPLGEYAGFTPGCTAEGLIPYYVCAVCFRLTDANGNLLADPTLPAGHVYEWVDEIAPTCTEPGIAGHYTCTLCGGNFDGGKAPLEELSIAPLGHTPGMTQIENVEHPTCIVAGAYDEVVFCATCCAEIGRTRTLTPAVGHDWGEWEVVKQATVSEEGLMRRVCRNDSSHIEEEIIPKLQPQTNAFQRFIQRIVEFFSNIVDWFRRLFRF